MVAASGSTSTDRDSYYWDSWTSDTDGTVTVVTLRKTMIRSHLEYAQTVWSPFRAKLIQEVKRGPPAIPVGRHSGVRQLCVKC